MDKPKTQDQGKAIVERHGIYYIMTPDGRIAHRRTKKAVESYLKMWAEYNVDSMSIGFLTVEWR